MRAPRGKTYRFDDLRPGLNTSAAAYLLDQGQARDLMNVVSTTRGAVRKRDGSVRLGALASTPHSVFGVDAFASKVLLVGHGGTLSKVAPDGAVTQLATGLTAGKPWEWVQAPLNATTPRVYGSNGSELRYFDGTSVGTWTLSSTATPAITPGVPKFFVYAGTRLLCAGGTNPSSVYISDLGNPSVFNIETQLDPNDGDVITGMGTVGPYVVVFKRKKVFVITDTDTGANRRMTDNLGCISHRSIVETPRGTFFLSDRGVCSTNGLKVDDTPVSDLVSPTIEPAGETSCAALLGDRYYLAFPASGAAPNDRVLDFDLRTGAWWLHDLRVAQFARWRPALDPELYAAHSVAPAVDRLFVPKTWQDAGVNYDAWWTSAWFAFGEPAVSKRCREIAFDGSGKFDLLIGRDFAAAMTKFTTVDFTPVASTFGGDGEFGGDGTFGGDSGVGAKSVFSLGVGRVWSAKFFASHDGPLEVDSFTMAMDRRSR